jgi:hypothetical protein
MSSRNEKQFQNYFMKIAKPLNFYRTSLVNGSGFPDVVGFHGERYSLVELKDLELGKRGNKKLKQCFQPTQPPWYMDYFARGGKRLFVAWRVRHEDKKWYGLWHLQEPEVKALIRNELYFSDLNDNPFYTHYDNCKQMIEEIEEIEEI